MIEKVAGHADGGRDGKVRCVPPASKRLPDLNLCSRRRLQVTPESRAGNGCSSLCLRNLGVRHSV